VRARTLDWLDGLASGDARVTALRDELACPVDAQPTVGVLHLSETPSGVLYLLRVDDPRGLLRAVRLTAAGRTVDILCEGLAWHGAHGTVAAGFAPTSGRSGGGVTIAPVFVSDRVGPVAEAAPTLFDGRVPGPFRGLGSDVVAPILAQALPAAMRARPVWRRRVTEFGPQAAAAGVAVVIAAGDAPEHLRAAIAALVAEPGGRNAEIVVHCADDPGAALVQQTVASLAAVHRVGIRLVSVAAESFASERLRAALAETRAPKVLALGPGDLPARSGWLAAWRRRVGPADVPTAAWVAGTGCEGSERGTDTTVGLNAPAVAQLVAARPLLPDVGPDLRATPGLAHLTARSLAVTSYEPAEGCELTREAQKIAVEAAQERANG
jgi:hypothetical protein